MVAQIILLHPSMVSCTTNLKEMDKKINTAKAGETVSTKYQAFLPMLTLDGHSIILNNVYVCENLSYNLMSVRQIENKAYRVIFENNEMKIMIDHNVILTGSLIENLYFIELELCLDTVNFVTDSELLHQRMEHSYKYPVTSTCEICLRGKQTNSSFFKSLSAERKAKHLFHYVSTDVCGKIGPSTHDEKNYFMTFVYHYSHFGIVVSYKRKE